MSPKILLTLLVAFIASCDALVPSDAIAYAGNGSYSLAPFKSQWAIKIFTGKIDTISTVSTADACISTVDFGFPCSQPPLQQFTGDAVKVSWTRANATQAIRTFKNEVPTQFYVRLCYTSASIIDRGWRKKNKGYPQYDNSCPITVGVVDYDQTGGSVTIDLGALSADDVIPTATFYAQVCVACSGAYCQCDNSKTTIETLKYDGRTVSMITACVILSAFCPLFLIIFWVADALTYNKTGRAIKLFYYH